MPAQQSWRGKTVGAVGARRNAFEGVGGGGRRPWRRERFTFSAGCCSGRPARRSIFFGVVLFFGLGAGSLFAVDFYVSFCSVHDKGVLLCLVCPWDSTRYTQVVSPFSHLISRGKAFQLRLNGVRLGVSLNKVFVFSVCQPRASVTAVD